MFARLSMLAIITALGTVGADGLSLSRASCQTIYSVVSGDTCNSIAAKVNVTTSALKSANPSIDPSCDNLFIGEQLCIPGTTAPPPPSPCASKYTVKSGDVCISIADQFNITVTQLETSNPAIDAACDNLRIGEVLCIP